MAYFDKSIILEFKKEDPLFLHFCRLQAYKFYRFLDRDQTRFLKSCLAAFHWADRILRDRRMVDKRFWLRDTRWTSFGVFDNYVTTYMFGVRVAIPWVYSVLQQLCICDKNKVKTYPRARENIYDQQ